jgi:hypothetical protein
MPPAGFTLKLGEGEHRVSMDVLAEALENALEMLRGVGQDFTGSVVRWEIVKASLKSPLTMTFAPSVQGNGKMPRSVGKQIVTACVNGLAGLEREAALPPHFNEEAMMAAQKLVKGVQKEGAKMTVASDRTNGVTPTVRIVENIKKVVEKARTYTDYGTIEGRLEVISVRGGTSISICEAFTNHRIDCEITTDRLQEAKDLLDERVAVTGRIHYRNRKPTSIHVESFRRLRDASELPQLEDMSPIDITGGLSSEEYIRRMRDAK